jgi:hypothetical protein
MPAHRRHGRAAHQPGPAQVDPDHVVEHVDRDLVDHVAIESLRCRGVVDEDVEPVEPLERRRHHRFGVVLVADVAERRDRGPAGGLDLFDQRVQTVPRLRLPRPDDLLAAVEDTGRPAIGDDDRDSVGGERAGDRLTATVGLAAAADERDPAVHSG